MTDRELLELAAKAAGIEVTAVVADGIPHRFGAGYWNPLTDDGDALRLAVNLGITVGPESPDVVGKSLCRVSWDNRSRSLGEYGGGSTMEATRRAIVRAAAEIGKDMK